MKIWGRSKSTFNNRKPKEFVEILGNFFSSSLYCCVVSSKARVLIYSFYKYLLITYYILGTILGDVNRTEIPAHVTLVVWDLFPFVTNPCVSYKLILTVFKGKWTPVLKQMGGNVQCWIKKRSAWEIRWWQTNVPAWNLRG